jgi:aminoglycoside 6'-N-acetyltransferase I
MACELFPGTDREEHAKNVDDMVRRDDCVAFGVRAPDGEWIGLIEVSERSYAEGCETSPVAYVEALWVCERARRRGVARSLVEAAENWASGRGHREIASDAQLDNVRAQAAHRRLGFAEVERVVCYRRALTSRTVDAGRRGSP